MGQVKRIADARRILVIRYRFLGDTILTGPFLKNLRHAYPSATIDVLVGPQSGEVLHGCPYVNDLIEFDTTRFHKYDSGAGDTKSFWSYVSLLRKRKYDTVFVLKRSWSSALLALLSGARNRIGYATEGRQILLTRGVPYNPQMHEVASTLSVLQAAGVEIVDDKLEAWISAQEQEQILNMVPELSTARRRVLIHPAAAHPDKMYPIESWAPVVRGLFEKHGMVPFYTGAERDTAMYRELESLCGVEGVHLAGKLSIRQSMALYSNMHLSVCVDSGPAHLSAATGTPTIALFGPTDPRRWQPHGEHTIALYDETLPCRPCLYKKTCDDRPCLTQYAPSKILEACDKLLQSACPA